MIKIIKVKLLPTAEQQTHLKQTSNVFVDVCNWLSERAFVLQEFRKNQLQKLIYGKCREAFPDFSSQLTVRAIDTVCQSYKLDKRKIHLFKKNSATVYDQRVLSFKKGCCSIWTMGGRLSIPVQIWDTELFGRNHGQTDLIHYKGNWYLHVSVWNEDIGIKPVSKYLGIDMGVNNIAVTSDGQIFSSDKIEKKRKQYAEHRRRLQLRNTRNSKRRIRRIGKKESRFRKDVNHQISKELIRVAKGTSRGISIENLNGINLRTTVRKDKRNQRMGWSFYQLGSFLEYKAAEQGIPFVKVTPKNTSRMCSNCGYIDKKNRKSQSEFICLKCGHMENADTNAAKNISGRATIN